jgi:polyphosphate kinase
LYEDVGLFTCDPAIGADLTKLFNTLTGFGRPETFEKLLVAPNGMRERIIEFIRGEFPTETRGPGRVFIKLNSLVDSEIISALYEASQQGVQVDLVVRGICCLRAGVPGLSENIRVRSVIGRYLEHSRIFHFANGSREGSKNGAADHQPVFLFGSADMMPRNLDGRVETLVPVTQPDLVIELNEIIDTLLRDDVRGWELHDSEWVRLGNTSENGHQDAREDAQHLRYQAVASARKRQQRSIR